MSGAAVTAGPRLAVVLLVLTAVAAVVAWFGRLGHARQIGVAAVRAAGQLAAVSLLIGAIVASAWFTAAFVVLMCVVAAWTSGRRITGRGGQWWAALPIAAGSVPVVVAVVAVGLVPARGIAVIPVAGILIGGAMTATSLAGRRAVDELVGRRGEVEAALALGMGDREAALEICRPAAGQALVPALDQTRTVGLVTLPGAFVGVLLGGGSPLAAGATQLFVLVGLLAVEAIAVVVTVELAARGRLRRPAAGPPRPRRSWRRYAGSVQ
ncbi:ABC transporter permease [Micromonospora sp. PPF5-17]|uniref:ABC transporter permease n=1 Tax=Micromonospora solifontis TaxID=2487138 RepID=A0ABX9WEB9_9ACTN|nr:ABC transporter permease [Micromonospora sp. PPF5-17B]NES38396.1 ABC transporter permease [Micromonospora solifontis]NES58736.1 ABC transporter permease [Micromonospora sp. PPF5-6]RNL95811.1 ABC transporter permease [Micromonospora solifontis]